jgi:glycerol-3-phosphate O-acyltransferase
LGYARAQGRRLGKVRVSVGEPLSLRAALAEDSASGVRRANEVEKVAFEICHRIGRATPITPTSLVTLALLGVEDRALTLAGVQEILEPLLEYVERRGLPTTADVDLHSESALRGTLDALAKGSVANRFADGLEPVYGIGPERHLEAAFYRNGSVHFFVNRAITELVLVRAAEEPSERVFDEAWQEALRLRDLLKFDFFFARKRTFSEEIREELGLIDPDWEQRPNEAEAARTVLSGMRLHLAHRVLRPFLEAYQVVADRLAAYDPGEPVDEKKVLAECIGLAHQYRLQRRLHSPESISKELFSTALRLAANRDLIAPRQDELRDRRLAFAAEIRAEVRRIATVRDLALRDLETAGVPA